MACPSLTKSPKETQDPTDKSFPLNELFLNQPYTFLGVKSGRIKPSNFTTAKMKTLHSVLNDSEINGIEKQM